MWIIIRKIEINSDFICFQTCWIYWTHNFFLSAHNMGKSKSHTCLVCCSMTKPIHKSVFILLETIFSVCLLKAGRSTPYHPRKQHYCDKKFCTINFIVSPYIAFLFITLRGRCNDLCTKQDNNKSLLGVKCPGAWSAEISLWAASSLLEVITRGMDWPLWDILWLTLNI